AVRIDFDVLVAARLGGFRRCGAERPWPAAKQRAHTLHELAYPERLGEVIVCAAFETDDLVRLLATRGQHQHGYVGIFGVAADGLADGDAVEAREHHI